MKQYIVWDWNGTLLDDLELCVKIVNEMLIEENVAPFSSIAAYQEVFQFPVIEYYRKAGFDFEKTSFQELAARYMERYQPQSLHCSLHQDTETVLNTISNLCKGQFLLSASQRSFLNEQLSQYEIQHYFLDIFGLDNYYAKSKQALAKQLMTQYQLAKEEVLFIGDSVHDFEVASSVGCDCVLIAKGHESRRKLELCGCQVYDDLNEFLENFLCGAL